MTSKKPKRNSRRAPALLIVVLRKAPASGLKTISITNKLAERPKPVMH